MMLMIESNDKMINKNNKIFIMHDCKKEWWDNNKNGKIKYKNLINNNKKDYIIRKLY